jgi:hypothetical protein
LTCSNVTAPVRRVLDPGRQRQRWTFSGPIEPATNRAAGLVGGLPGELRAAQVHLADERLQP